MGGEVNRAFWTSECDRDAVGFLVIECQLKSLSMVHGWGSSFYSSILILKTRKAITSKVNESSSKIVDKALRVGLTPRFSMLQIIIGIVL